MTFVTISGRITDAATGQPIVGACVAITTDDTQYAVVVEGNGGQVVVVVKEIAFSGGDAALMYEGF
ncbi:MAG: hypothetical protein Q7S41_02605, partial [Candidatus Limnocylindria bacterium]|nr:hypothetical protein [Candidatus Limnocylindria bacterium]